MRFTKDLSTLIANELDLRIIINSKGTSEYVFCSRGCRTHEYLFTIITTHILEEKSITSDIATVTVMKSYKYGTTEMVVSATISDQVSFDDFVTKMKSIDSVVFRS